MLDWLGDAVDNIPESPGIGQKQRKAPQGIWHRRGTQSKNTCRPQGKAEGKCGKTLAKGILSKEILATINSTVPIGFYTWMT